MQKSNVMCCFAVAKQTNDHALQHAWDNKLGGFYDAGYYFKDKPRLTIIIPKELVVAGRRNKYAAHDEPAFSQRCRALLRQIQTAVELHTNLHDRSHLWRLVL